MIHKKACSVCGKEFTTKYSRQNICSFECKQEAQRLRSRYSMRRKRKKETHEKCVVCGYNETIDLHHEGSKTYWLCPNHHALITRGIKSIYQVLNNLSTGN